MSFAFIGAIRWLSDINRGSVGFVVSIVGKKRGRALLLTLLQTVRSVYLFAAAAVAVRAAGTVAWALVGNNAAGTNANKFSARKSLYLKCARNVIGLYAKGFCTNDAANVLYG
jgi:hypothetical protein